MSQWRKIALDAVPSCKRTIEEAKSPAQMWLDLYGELYGRRPEQTRVNAQIYGFALRCLHNKQHRTLSADVWLFFHAVIGAYVVGIEGMQHDLPHHLSLADFLRWKEWMKFTFTQEQCDKAIQHFSAAKRSATFNR